MRYKCVRPDCGEMRETSQEMLTCSDPCKSWYKRWKKKNPGETLGPIIPTDEEWEAYQEQKRIDEWGSQGGRRGVASQPSHDEAVISYQPPPGHKLITDEMHDVLMHMLMTKATGGEKKSDFVANQTVYVAPLIDTPLVVKEASDEERKELSIKNTLAALADF